MFCSEELRENMKFIQKYNYKEEIDLWGISRDTWDQFCGN